MPTASRKRVVVGMSGGVDSSVAAALLQEQGWDVIGANLRLWRGQRCSGTPGPPGEESAAANARAACQALGIPFFEIDEQEEFGRQVVDCFVSEYRHGRTPNPCVLCNERVKVGRLLAHAEQWDAQYVATGHYARIEIAPDGGRASLKRGVDPQKDQSYFLFSLRQEQLVRCLTPLGHWSKSEVRREAARRGLPTASRAASMDICFVPGGDYRRFLTEEAGVEGIPGDMVDREERVLGRHRGIEFYTIGQRRGLGVPAAHRWYVVGLDPEQNRVVLGRAEELYRSEFVIERCNWIAFDAPPVRLDATARIRSQHAGTPATVAAVGEGRAQVRLHVPQRAVTPGQAAVFYQGDAVLGGGWIVSERG